MNKRIRYGIIGCGSMGREHIENIKALDGTIVTAIADPHAHSRDLALALLTQPQVFDDYRKLLASNLFLVISTPATPT
jgi:predicted dehydrogenase